MRFMIVYILLLLLYIFFYRIFESWAPEAKYNSGVEGVGIEKERDLIQS